MRCGGSLRVFALRDVRADARFVVDEEHLPGTPVRHLFTEGRMRRHALVVGAVLHGLRHLDRCDAVDAGLVAA